MAVSESLFLGETLTTTGTSSAYTIRPDIRCHTLAPNADIDVILPSPTLVRDLYGLGGPMFYVFVSNGRRIQFKDAPLGNNVGAELAVGPRWGVVWLNAPAFAGWRVLELAG